MKKLFSTNKSFPCVHSRQSINILQTVLHLWMQVHYSVQNMLKYLTGQLIREALAESIAHRRKVGYYPAIHTQETNGKHYSPEFPGKSAAETVSQTNAE